MEQFEEDMDYFKVLEEKVGYLIDQIKSLREERETLKGKILVLEENVNGLTSDLNSLRQTKSHARERVASILERIDQLDV